MKKVQKRAKRKTRSAAKGRSAARTSASRKPADEQLEIAKGIASIAADHKAEEIAVLDLRGLSSFTDYFIICSGTSDRHVQAIAESIVGEMRREGRRTLGEEGVRAGRWALLDFGGIVVHVFYHADREHYQLERLWYDAPRVTLRGVTG